MEALDLVGLYNVMQKIWEIIWNSLNIVNHKQIPTECDVIPGNEITYMGQVAYGKFIKNIFNWIIDETWS